MDTMCPHPWAGLEITPQGKFIPCCSWRGEFSDSLESYMASEEVAEVRQQMLQGQQPKACRKCWQEEAHGVPSKRLIDREQIPGDPQEMTPLQMLVFPFGNTCNLACRICNSHYSSRWGTEERRMIEIYPDTKIHQHNKFYLDQSLIANLKTLTKNVRRVEFPGGEPFITGIDEQLDFLDHLILHNSQDIVLNYQTNGTTWPDARFWDRWKHFRRVEIIHSVDGIGAEFEYNRWPASWNHVSENLLKIRQDSVGSNIQIDICSTISVFTIASVADFMHWCLKNQLPKPYYNLLIDPGYYDARILPKTAKEKLLPSLPKYIQYWLMSEDFSHRLPEFEQRTKTLDQLRNQDFATTFPKLNQLIKDHYATLCTHSS